MSDIERTLLQSLVGTRMGSRPEARKFCVEAAAAIERHHGQFSSLRKTMNKAFPVGDRRLELAGEQLEKFARTFVRMTPQERISFAVRTFGDDTYAAVGVDKDDNLGELYAAVDRIANALGACRFEPPKPSRDQPKKQPRGPVYVPRLLAESWRRHFDEEPKASNNSPFYFATRDVCKSLGINAPAPDTVNKALAEVREALAEMKNPATK